MSLSAPLLQRVLCPPAREFGPYSHSFKFGRSANGHPGLVFQVDKKPGESVRLVGSWCWFEEATEGGVLSSVLFMGCSSCVWIELRVSGDTQMLM